jgi:peptidoglycan-N-acetylglucosamine deacetylase
MPLVTLTFDNGPEPDVTPFVLDCLAAHRAQATFFVIGRKVVEAEGEAIVRRASRAGHWIGNHTFSHTTPLGELDAAAALAEFELAERALKWVEQPQRLFRPYGRRGKLGRHLLHPAVVERLRAGGYSCVLWNFLSRDWEDPEGWAARALADCRTREHSMVVLHDVPSGAMKHLDWFLRGIREAGMEITQDFPVECVPVARGKIVLPMDEYMG